MDETFYTALGIDSDAETETIKRAYRDHIKETHPDVSDDPDATEEFKRLTTARDVLVDGTERERYDRLGHTEYVREHVTDSAWTVGNTPNRQGEPSSPRKTTGRERNRTQSSQQTGSWYTNITEESTSRRTASASATGRRTRTNSRADGGYGNADWQTASEAYTRTEMNVGEEDSSIAQRAIGVANALGPWLFVHILLLASAGATSVFFFLTSLHAELSLGVLVGATALVILGISLSTLHILLQVHS